MRKKTKAPIPTGHSNNPPQLPGASALTNNQLKVNIYSLIKEIEKKIEEASNNNELTNVLIEFFYTQTRDNRLGRIMDKISTSIFEDAEKLEIIHATLEHVKNQLAMIK